VVEVDQLTEVQEVLVPEDLAVEELDQAHLQVQAVALLTLVVAVVVQLEKHLVLEDQV
tara:strand:+ start:349 stop:522 length:174 start_codon:yes stop_codon:yes gene_type:complete